MSIFTKDQLMSMEEVNLHALAQALEIADYAQKKREDLVYDILDQQAIVSASQMNKPKTSTRSKKKKTVAEKSPESSADKVEVTATNSEEEQSSAPKRKRGRTAKVVKEVTNKETSHSDKEENLSASTNESNAITQAEATALVDEVPEFVKEQLYINDSDTVQSDDESQTPDSQTSHQNPVDITEDSMSPTPPEDNIPNVNEGETDLPEEIRKAEQDGIDFVVIADIPEVYNTDIYENIEPTLSKPKFRKFSEDPLVNKHLHPMESATNMGEQDAIQNSTNKAQPITNTPIEDKVEIFLEGRGVLELMTHGTGFLRSSDYNYLASPDDIYVDAATIRQYNLKQGDVVEGKVRPPRDNEKYFILVQLDRINGRNPIDVRDRVSFEHLTPLFPEEKFQLCKGKSDSMSLRIVDLFTPIGKGQRALIVAQPKTGKTILMKEIANAIAENHPDTYMMMLLIDERPEEVTDMARTVKAEVIASTFDEPASRHVKIANIVLEKAKRLVECGRDVVIFLDSITRLARAYNTVSPASGKVLSGGVDANALQKPKRFFGAARNIEGGGSLTIIATALIDTGSKMDEVIFEEFKGTGNMELQLDRNLANKRIFPAVNIVASSTRRDDLLQDESVLGRMWLLRNYISEMTPIEAMTDVKKRMEGTLNNEEYLSSMNS